MRILRNLSIMFVSMLFLSGCLLYQNQSRSYSSIADYLYPEKTQSSENIAIKASVPQLRIPLNVGIAFVPESCGTFKQFNIDENLKTELMEKVAAEFKAREYINKIEIIPSGYLVRKGSFKNLRHIKKMFNVDVIVLLSYDQVQYTEQNFLSLVYYYTIVGRYVFEGDKNDTVTLIDAAIYDIDSQKLLFRAPGSSQVKGGAKRAYLVEELRKDSHNGFQLAMTNGISNLDKELELFRTKIREKKADVVVTYRRGYSGGGSVDWLMFLMTSMVFLFISVIRRRT